MAQSKALVDGDRIAQLLADYREGAIHRASIMADGRRGITPKSIFEPKDGESESASSLSLMERVAVALADPTHFVEDRTCPGGEREADFGERLARAKCSAELYYQMADNPLYMSIYGRANMKLRVLPDVPKSLGALMEKAKIGDTRAMDMVLKLTAMLETTDVDGVKAEFRHMDFDAAIALLEAEGAEQAEAAKNLGHDVVPPTESELLLIEDARPEAPPEPEKIDHTKIHNGSS